MLSIYKKELRGYFTSIMGYIVSLVLIAIIGFYFMGVNLTQGSSVFGYTLSYASFVLIIVLPLLTMRTFAEEQKQKTDQLLLSAPIKISSIVIGKFLAVATVFTIPILVCCTMPLVMTLYGKVVLQSAYAAVLAFWLLGLSLIAIGMIVSSLTDNQIIAAVLGVGINVLVFLMHSLATSVSSSSMTSLIGITVLILAVAVFLYLFVRNIFVAAVPAVIGEAALVVIYFVKPALLEGLLSTILSSISFYSRFADFLYGSLDLTSILFYVSFIGFFLYLTVQIIEKRRWN